MLTNEQITLLRQTAKRTPMGDFLRQYWHPVAMASDLDDETRAKRVRVLSQPLVLFKDRSGRAALVPERCPHEGASMLMGAITDHGITCVLHGWTFDTERMSSVWDDDSVWAEGYSALEYAGFFWAYLGDPPPPPLSLVVMPKKITQYPLLRLNWLFDVAPRLPAGQTWLLTPADREQTTVFAIEPSVGNAEAVGNPDVATGAELVLQAEGDSAIAADLIAPWGASIPARSQLSAVYDDLLARLAAMPSSVPEQPRG